MNMKTALVSAQDTIGELAYVNLEDRGQCVVGTQFRGRNIIYGVAPTWQEAIAMSERTITARKTSNLAFANIGYVALTADGYCEVGIELYGEHVKLGSATTFEEAFKRASMIPAAQHAEEAQDVCERTKNLFGPRAKVVLGERLDWILIKRGDQTLGYGKSFVEAFENAIKNEKADRERTKARKQYRRNERRSDAKTVQHEAELVSAAVGPLELSTPA